MTARALTALCLTAGALALPQTAALADPPGNNGTVKVDGVPIESDHANEPHVGCSFALRFFGFDAGQTADITFTAQAPTDGGELLSQEGVAISDDAAGGGNDADAVLTFTADDLGLTGTPQAAQGWHVKLAVDVLEAPGGAKQKVLWISCPAEEAPVTGGDTTEEPTPDTDTDTGTETDTDTDTGTETEAGTDTFTGGSAVVTPPQQAVTAGSGTLATALDETAGGGALTFAAPTEASLPHTGAPLAQLLPMGLGAVALGGLVLVAARRRREA